MLCDTMSRSASGWARAALLARRLMLFHAHDNPKLPRAYASRPGGKATEDETFAATPSADITPEEQIDAAHQLLTSALKADLLARVLDQPPSFFERLIVELLVAMGYGGSHEDAARQLGKSGDGGIDGVVDEDRLGLDRIYVQAKRYAPGSSVGRPEVQGFVGSLVGVGASKGVFVTTSTFSSHAIGYADGLPQRVVLIDGERLTELMIEFGVGVRETIESDRRMAILLRDLEAQSFKCGLIPDGTPRWRGRKPKASVSR